MNLKNCGKPKNCELGSDMASGEAKFFLIFGLLFHQGKSKNLPGFRANIVSYSCQYLKLTTIILPQRLRVRRILQLNKYIFNIAITHFLQINLSFYNSCYPTIIPIKIYQHEI